MDIGEFYDADDRRRESAEVELGTEWHDAHGVRYELSWIADTAELYVMREPPPPGAWEDPFGGIHVRTDDKVPLSGMSVFVIAHVETQAKLEAILDGWQQAMPQEDSIAWLKQRLEAAGAADPGWASEPS